MTKTSATASRKIGRLLAANCRQDVRCTAAYSSGGSSSGRISSGGISTFGTKSQHREHDPEQRHQHRRGQPEPVPQRHADHGPEQQHEQQGQLVHGEHSAQV